MLSGVLHRWQMPLHVGVCGVQGLVGWMTNPVLANSLAGLSTSAWAQAAVEVNSLSLEAP